MAELHPEFFLEQGKSSYLDHAQQKKTIDDRGSYVRGPYSFSSPWVYPSRDPYVFPKLRFVYPSRDPCVFPKFRFVYPLKVFNFINLLL